MISLCVVNELRTVLSSSECKDIYSSSFEIAEEFIHHVDSEIMNQRSHSNSDVKVSFENKGLDWCHYVLPCNM